MTFTILTLYLESFFNALDKQNKKQAQPVTPTIETRINDNGQSVTDITFADDYIAPTIEGFTFIGMVDTEFDNPIVRLQIGQNITPSQHLALSGERCDYCNQNRRRATSFLFKDADGEVYQIGSSCVGEFFGRDVLGGLVSSQWLEDWQEQETSNNNGSYNGLFDLVRYLEVANIVISKVGYTSKANAESWGKTPTTTLINDYFVDSFTRDYFNNLPSKADVVDVMAAIEWAETLSGNEYNNNVSHIAKARYFNARKHSGFAASIIPSYMRHLEKLAAAKHAAPIILPDTNKRVIVVGTITGIKQVESKYALTTKMTVQSLDGFRVYVSLPSSISHAEVGDTVKFTAQLTANANDATHFYGNRPTKSEILQN